jgi:wobble nucleotide-excising tRNase
LQEYPNPNETPLPELQEIRDLYRAAYGEKRDEYPLYLEIDEVEVKRQEKCPLLAQRISGSSETPVGKFIEFLNNSDWVKQGIGYIEKADGKCPYCQQPLPPSIQQDIEAFFDETYEKECAAVRTYQMQYEAFTKALLSKLRGIYDNPIPILDYVLFKSEVNVLDAAIEVNKKTIQDKITSPSTLVRIDSVETIIQRINKIVDDFNNTIKRNNEIVRNKAREKDRCKKLLWQYFTNELRQPIQQYKKDYEGKTNGINSLRDKLKEQSDNKSRIEKQIEEKEATLTSVIPTVNAINGILKRFGFESFYLADNTEEKGTYKIVRPDGTNARKTLSEGEYNFITFLYFYHLIYGSQDKTHILADKVVIIDDPISSLDSNVLFIMTTLIRTILQDCMHGEKGIQQVFILTHNVYFHKEVTFLGSRKKYPTKKTAYWILKKTNNITEIVQHEKNPIQTSYELLWSELKDVNAQSRLTIFNTLRRILEYYFNIIGGMDYEECINKFEGDDKILCKALISCINEGSHFITDDFVMCYESETLDNYLRVFRLIFEKMGHGSHYRMMMGIPETIVEL